MTRYWNWKCAVLSIALRTPLFFIATSGAGLTAATAAAATDLTARFVFAGFLGAFTQRLSRTRGRAGTITALIIVPPVAHTIEFIVHASTGTARLTTALSASLAVTVVSTAFDLYAMRRGVFTVGAGSATLLDDLRRVPGLLADIVRNIFRCTVVGSGFSCRGVRL